MQIEIWKMLFTVDCYFKRQMTFREADELFVCSAELDRFFKPALLRSKTTYESSIDE
jgi:hypothetical protein